MAGTAASEAATTVHHPYRWELAGVTAAVSSTPSLRGMEDPPPFRRPLFRRGQKEKVGQGEAGKGGEEEARAGRAGVGKGEEGLAEMGLRCTWVGAQVGKHSIGQNLNPNGCANPSGCADPMADAATTSSHDHRRASSAQPTWTQPQACTIPQTGN